MRRRQTTEEARFAPLFDVHWKSAYPTLSLAFPAVDTAWAMKKAVKTFTQSADMSLIFTPPGLDGLCILFKNVLRQLEANAPAASSNTDDRIGELIKLVHRSSRSSLSAKDPDRLEGDERFDKLLADADYANLYTSITALNTSTFNAVDAVRAVAKHKHPAGHIILVTARTLPQAAWTSVLGMRQKAAWQALFDQQLAVDRLDVAQRDWGTMLPMQKETPIHAQWLLQGHLDKIPDWWAMVTPWIRKFHGDHVLDLPMYAVTGDPIDFWLCADRLRLAEPALGIIFAAIAQGDSRSVPGSFREWLHFQMERCTLLHHIPAGTPAFVALMEDTRSAVRLLFSHFSEAFSTMLTRPFHEARRQIFNPPGGAASAFAAVDTTMRTIQTQLALARKGQAAHQAPQLQNMRDALSVFGSPSAATVTQAISPASVAKGTTPTILSTGGAAHTWPPNVFLDWGHAAVKLGIWICPEGIAFGNNKVSLEKTVTFANGTCIAAAAPAKDARSRSKWCVDPERCKALGYAAHERADGTTDADYKTVKYNDNTEDRSSWKVVIPARPELRHETPPDPPWSTLAGPTKNWRNPGAKKRDVPDLRNKLNGKKPKANFERPPTGSKPAHSGVDVRTVESAARYASCCRSLSVLTSCLRTLTPTTVM